MQAHGEYGLIVGGRSEILVSAQAIMDSPILGHGSWAKNEEYAAMLNYLRESMGYVAQGKHESGLIPTHSHIFGAWVEAGILGAVFWLWILTVAHLVTPRKTTDRAI